MKILTEISMVEYYEKISRKKSEIPTQIKTVLKNLSEITGEEFSEIYEYLQEQFDCEIPTDEQLNNYLENADDIAKMLGFTSWEKLLDSRERHEGYIYLVADLENGEENQYIPAWSRHAEIREEFDWDFGCDIGVVSEVSLASIDFEGYIGEALSKSLLEKIEQIIEPHMKKSVTVGEIASYIEENADQIARQMGFDTWENMIESKEE